MRSGLDERAPQAPNFQCYFRRRRGRSWYSVPAAPDLAPIEVTGLGLHDMCELLYDVIGEHFGLVDGTFFVTLA